MNSIQKWIKSGLPIAIRNSQLSPIVKDNNICVKEGAQGTTYQLVQKSTGKGWVIKKFHHHAAPPREYLDSVRRLLPDHEAFTCAKKRMILKKEDFKEKDGVFHAPMLASWFNNCVLMQEVPGKSWKEISNAVRNGRTKLSRQQRIILAKKLTQLISLLEQNGCAHRDLSHENIFFDLKNSDVYIVDWDSMYHESLSYQKNTTLGSLGYMSPWVVQMADKNMHEGKELTWNAHADRFPLGILIAELLQVEKGTPLQKEGVLFSKDLFLEDEHPEVAKKVQEMYNISEDLGDLFLQCVTAKSCSECPHPEEWEQVLSSMDTISVPNIPSMEHDDEYEDFEEYDEEMLSETSLFRKSSDALKKYGQISGDALKKYGQMSSDTLKKYGDTAHKSYLRVKLPLLSGILFVLLLLLLLPWLIPFGSNKENDDNNTNTAFMGNNSVVEPSDNTNTAEDIVLNNNNTDVVTVTNSTNNNEPHIEYHNINDNSGHQPISENSEITPEIEENSTITTTSSNSNSEEPVIIGFNEVTNAKEYRLKIEYASNDLRLHVNNQPRLVDDKNECVVYLTPGIHNINIFFSAIQIKNDGTMQNLGNFSYSQDISFSDKSNITIRINRVKKIWKIIN